jgi:NADH-quinone oxidoreductase subunit C
LSVAVPLTPSEIGSRLQVHFPETVLQEDQQNPVALKVPADRYRELAATLRQDPDLDFDYLEFQTCCDRPPDHLDFLAYFFSYRHGHRVALKVEMDRVAPSLPSLADLWANADWNEREVFDLFGVVFHGHPDLRRIMMPEDWEGYPLRKDYLHPNVVKRPD